MLFSCFWRRSFVWLSRAGRHALTEGHRKAVANVSRRTTLREISSRENLGPCAGTRRGGHEAHCSGLAPFGAASLFGHSCGGGNAEGGRSVTRRIPARAGMTVRGRQKSGIANLRRRLRASWPPGCPAEAPRCERGALGLGARQIQER